MIAERKPTVLLREVAISIKPANPELCKIYMRGIRLGKVNSQIKELNKWIPRRKKWDIFEGSFIAETRRSLFLEKRELDWQQKIARMGLRAKKGHLRLV